MKMKSFLVGLTLAASVILVQAQSYTGFATPGTAIGVSTNYAIIPGESAAQLQQQAYGSPVTLLPVVNYLNLSGLSSAAITLQSYVSTNSTSANYANSTTTIPVVSTNGWAAGWAVIHHQASDARFADEAIYVSSLGATNLVAAIAPVTAVGPGDTIFAQVASASIPVASSTTAVAISGSGILTGQRGKPYLLILSSTAGTNTINAANATFIP